MTFDRSERYRIGEFELDAIQLELRRGRDPIAIRRLPLRVLVHLVRHRDRTVSKDEVAEAIWPGQVVSDAALTSAVRDLRRALGANGTQWVHTQRGRGYRFMGPVEERPADASTAAVEESRVGGEPFVGRADVLASLAAALARAAGGHGSLVLLAGEAGVGKTRLTDVLVRRAEAHGFEVLVGRCLEADGAPPFWPWLQILRALVGRRSPASLREELGTGAVDIARLMPEIRDRLPELSSPPAVDQRLARFRFLDAATELLVRARPDRQRLLVLDDLHRADPSSLELLDHLVSSLDASRVLVVGTYRDTDVQRDAAVATLLGRLGRRGDTELLGALGREDVARYCELALGSTQDEETVAGLAERSGGNPFLLKLLVSLRRRRNAASGPERLPSGLTGAVLAQLDAVPHEGRRLLQAASVFGREFRPVAAAHVAGIPLEPALALLALAADQRIVTRDEPAGPHRFVHALIAEVLYERLSVAERLDLHGRAGLALETLLGNEGEHVSELAHHFCEAAPAGFGERAVAACVRAAQRATSDLAYEESARLWERALEVLARLGGTDAERLPLLLEAGEAWARQGSVEPARQHFVQALGIARSIGDAEAHGRAALGVCGDEDAGIPNPIWVAILEEAERVVTEKGALRARILGRLGYAIWWAEPREKARSLLREALALGRRVGESDALARIASQAHFVLHAPGLLDERLAIASELQRLADSIGDESLLTEVAVARAWDALVLGDRAAFDAALGRLEDISERLRQPPSDWWLQTLRGTRDAFSGHFAEADAAWMRARRIGEEAASPFRSRLFYNQIPALRLDQGLPEEARSLSEGIVRLSPHPQARCAWLLARAICGDVEPARALLGEQCRDGFSAMTDDVSWYNVANLLAEICREVEDAGAAAALYELLLPVRREHFVLVAGWVYRGSVERHLGLLAGLAGDPETAIGHFERGLASERALGARPSVATGLLDWGSLLLRHGDTSRAREPLEEALAIAAELGMRRVETQVRALLSGC